MDHLWASQRLNELATLRATRAKARMATTPATVTALGSALTSRPGIAGSATRRVAAATTHPILTSVRSAFQMLMAPMGMEGRVGIPAAKGKGKQDKGGTGGNKGKGEGKNKW